MNLESYIRDVPDFPKKGIIFKDITPLLGNAEAFRHTIDCFTEKYRDKAVEVVVAIEARGLILGAPIAYNLGASFVPVRKAGKLPAELISAQYSLEYGFDSMEMHKDAHGHGEKVLIIDDLLATGGTAAAAADLVKQLGGDVVGIAFLIELTFLGGREKLKGYDVTSLLEF